MSGDRSAKRGIWCLETVWFDSESNASMRPMLELVNSLYGTPFVHRNAVTRDEFFYFLDAWVNVGRGSEREYPILILSYHGSQGTICLKDDPTIDWSDDESLGVSDSVVTLDEIQQRLAGQCRDRVIHFSSCSSLDVRHDNIEDFLDQTEASAISGYTKEVPWTQALALDLLYLEEIQTANFVKLTPKRMSEVNEEFDWTSGDIKDHFDHSAGYLPSSDMRKALGFNMRFLAIPAR